jgi:hypothetical protein
MAWHLVKHRDNFTFFTFYETEVIDQIHAQVALPPGKELQVSILQEAGWASEPVWTRCLKRKISSPRRESNQDHVVVQSVACRYTDCAIPDHTRTGATSKIWQQ